MYMEVVWFDNPNLKNEIFFWRRQIMYVSLEVAEERMGDLYRWYVWFDMDQVEWDWNIIIDSLYE